MSSNVLFGKVSFLKAPLTEKKQINFEETLSFVEVSVGRISFSVAMTIFMTSCLEQTLKLVVLCFSDRGRDMLLTLITFFST